MYLDETFVGVRFGWRENWGFYSRIERKRRLNIGSSSEQVGSGYVSCMNVGDGDKDGCGGGIHLGGGFLFIYPGGQILLDQTSLDYLLGFKNTSHNPIAIHSIIK